MKDKRKSSLYNVFSFCQKSGARCASVIAILQLWITQAHDDMFQSSHSCYQPQNPYQFSDSWERDNFMKELEVDRLCIEEFVEEQNEQARGHHTAAEEAIDEWNSYVAYELN